MLRFAQHDNQKALSSPFRAAAGSCVVVLLMLLSGCGGGGGSTPRPPAPPPPPPPATLTITTSSLPSGTQGQAYAQTTVQASGGTGARTWSATGLPAGLTIGPSTGTISGTPTVSGNFTPTIQVQDQGSPQQTATRQLSLVVNPPPTLTITTTSLPAGVVGAAYSTTVQASGGTPPLTWSEPTSSFSNTTGAGASATPCQGLTLSFSAGTITGTPANQGTCGPFDIRVDDSAAQFDTQTGLSILINAQGTGRNDTTATATPLTTNGDRTISASISPFSDPSSSGPDQDFYRLTATAGATVMVEIFARAPRKTPHSPLDSVLEIVRANGTRFTTCREGGDGSNTGAVSGTFTTVVNGVVVGVPDNTPTAFDDECINDDIELGVVRDSRMEFEVPGSGTVEFFIGVLDFRGDARPDLLYNLTITGAN